MSDIRRLQPNARMSKAVCHAGLVYLCGQTAKASKAADGDITGQTHEVLARIDALLVDSGSHRSRILSTTVFLRDIADFDGMNAVWESWLEPGSAPARTTIEARLATASLRVEMTVVAAMAEP